MSAAPPVLSAGPLPDERKALLARVVEGLDSASLWWVSGFTAGLAQAAHPAPHLALLQGSAGIATLAAAPGERATVLYGSQTGNAKRAAESLAAELEGAGLSVRLARTDSYATRELA
ncbi:MAG: flavodoxin domain-containing protein, partial [Pseudoxanthomonas sp.]